MTIEVFIGKSSYQINCKEEEKEKILNLAKKVNQKVNNLSISLKTNDEKTLLALACIMAEDELEKNYEEKQNENDCESFSEDDVLNAVSDSIENMAEYIENLTKKIINY